MFIGWKRLVAHHPKLIQANIALFQGAPAEARRLLQEYIADGGDSAASAPMAMWLDAQAQANRDERIRRLRALVESVEPDNPYAQLARDYLRAEQAYESTGDRVPPRSRLTLLDVPLWKALGFALAGGLVTLLAMSMIYANNAAHVAAQPTAISQTPLPFNLPDRSRALVADSYTARYPQGLLQVTAVEEESERVADGQSQALVTPVPGARFFALRVIFECRGGICDHPPQAKLALRLGDGTLIEPREGLLIGGESTLQPIALGRTTAGWVVFEIPLVSPVEALVVSPLREGDFEPVSIQLGIPLG